MKAAYRKKVKTLINKRGSLDLYQLAFRFIVIVTFEVILSQNKANKNTLYELLRSHNIKMLGL